MKKCNKILDEVDNIIAHFNVHFVWGFLAGVCGFIGTHQGYIKDNYLVAAFCYALMVFFVYCDRQTIKIFLTGHNKVDESRKVQD